MIIAENNFSYLEVLLQAIYNTYLKNNHCVAVVSETPFNFNFLGSFTSLTFTENKNLFNLLLKTSDLGCSDYIVNVKDPQNFMVIFDEVNFMSNTRRSDKKIIFTKYHEESNLEVDLLSILSFEQIKYVPNVLLIIPKIGNYRSKKCLNYDLITHKYTGTIPSKFSEALYLDSWDSCSEKFQERANLFPHDISNVQGKALRVAAMTYKPYALLDLKPGTQEDSRDGIEIRVVEEFCRWINCTIELVRDDDNEWGEIFDNRTGNGIIGNVLENRADLGICALYSWYEEYVVMDFSSPTIKTSITCIAPAARSLPMWMKPYLAFSPYMWTALLFTYIFSSMSLVIALQSFRNAFFITYQMMISQPLSVLFTWRIRIVAGWLLMAGLVLASAYSSGLAYSFTVTKYEKAIDTAEDIVDRKVEWGATSDAWIFSLLLSQEPVIKQLVNQFKIFPNDVLKEKSFTGTMAFSVERLPAGNFAIGEYITPDVLPNFELMLEDFYLEYCVVMLKKSSPYTAKINQLLGRLHQSGIISAWETQVALKYMDYKVQLGVKLSRSRRNVSKLKPLNLNHVAGIFGILVVGIVASTVFFLAEVMLYWLSKGIS